MGVFSCPWQAAVEKKILSDSFFNIPIPLIF